MDAVDSDTLLPRGDDTHHSWVTHIPEYVGPAVGGGMLRGLTKSGQTMAYFGTRPMGMGGAGVACEATADEHP